MINEEIFPIKNAEGYFVSKNGNVYSNKKHKKSKKILKSLWRFLLKHCYYC